MVFDLINAGLVAIAPVSTISAAEWAIAEAWELRRLEREGFTNLQVATIDQLDLRDQAAVNYWFRANRPEYVFLVAGTVGGILANSTRPAEFIYDNMMIHATVVHAAHLFPVRRATGSRRRRRRRPAPEIRWWRPLVRRHLAELPQGRKAARVNGRSGAMQVAYPPAELAQLARARDL